jgi:hypothetical protein
METHVGVTAQPVVPFGFVRVQIVQDHMNLSSRMLADYLVHEIEKLTPAPARIVARPNLPGSHIQSRKQSGSSMPLVIMAEATQRPASRNFQVPLSPLQRLNIRFLIDRQDQGGSTNDTKY